MLLSRWGQAGEETLDECGSGPISVIRSWPFRLLVFLALVLVAWFAVVRFGTSDEAEPVKGHPEDIQTEVARRPGLCLVTRDPGARSPILAPVRPAGRMEGFLRPPTTAQRAITC